MEKVNRVNKNMLSLVLTAFIFLFSATYCLAAVNVPIDRLNRLAGNWYDSKGKVMLSIGNDGKINGYAVSSIHVDNTFRPLFFGEATWICKALTNGSNTNISIENGGLDYHRMIIYNGKFALRKDKVQKYYESVGGIYLGMDKDQVVSLYGTPSKAETAETKREYWTYNNEGFKLEFAGNVVISIEIYKKGNRKFDKSGLSAHDTLETDRNFYHAKPGLGAKDLLIGYGEVITVSKNNGVRLWMAQNW